MQDSKAAAAADEHQQELANLKERVQQMTNRMGQMEQKVGRTLQTGRAFAETYPLETIHAAL